MPPRSFPFRGAPSSRVGSGGGRPGIFHRESTRLRSNVADQVQRDLLPAGRMLSVFLILCELLAEVAVLIWSRCQSCDRPLRFWVQVLIVLQSGTIVLNCLKIWQGRDTFGQHRNGLSATDIDMYTGTPSSRLRSSSAPSGSSGPTTLPPSFDPSAQNDSRIGSSTFVAPVILDVGSSAAQQSIIGAPDPEQILRQDTNRSDNRPSSIDENDTQPLLYTQTGSFQLSDSSTPTHNSNIQNDQSIYHPSSSSSSISQAQVSAPRDHSVPARPDTASQQPRGHAILSTSPSLNNSHMILSFEFVDRYMRIVNAWYLVWFILGSVWVSDGGNCSANAPHLYRLIVALTIIYYALLFLPLACFCLIVCCLPLFILVYRIMLPYAERERRRARAADPIQVQNLDTIVYSPERFATYTDNQNPDDASCVICLCEYEPEDVIRFLPCKHHFHKDCVDVWLRLDKACCLCKQDIDAPLGTDLSTEESASTTALTPVANSAISTAVSTAATAAATTLPAPNSSSSRPVPSSSVNTTASEPDTTMSETSLSSQISSLSSDAETNTSNRLSDNSNSTDSLTVV